MLILGFSFKFFKVGLSYYNIAQKEYEFYNIRTKKISVYPFFLKKTIYCTIRQEFAQSSTIPQELNIKVMGRNKKIICKIIDNQKI